MKKSLIFLMIIVLLTALCGCSSGTSSTQEADAVINDFFDCWSKADLNGMKKYIINGKINGDESDIVNTKAVTVISTTEGFDTSGAMLGKIKSEGYTDPYQSKIFSVEFQLVVKDDAEVSKLSAGEYFWNFYLEKHTENSPWVIVGYNYK